MRRGQPRQLSFIGDPGGARRRPLLRFSGVGRCSSGEALMPMPLLTPGPGTDGNRSCGFGVLAADEDSAAVSLMDDSPFHASGDGDDLAGDMA
jgi:hypothetical protein